MFFQILSFFCLLFFVLFIVFIDFIIVFLIRMRQSNKATALEERIKIIKRAKKGETTNSTASNYSIKLTIVQMILKRKEIIEKDDAMANKN